MNFKCNTCIIGIGSNIAAEVNIKKMLEILGGKVNIVKISSLVQTNPIGKTDQPDYINGAVKITTTLSIIELKSVLVSIEDQLGRNRHSSKFDSRTMDLDIVVWNGIIVDDDYYTREFLKKSIQEIN